MTRVHLISQLQAAESGDEKGDAGLERRLLRRFRESVAARGQFDLRSLSVSLSLSLSLSRARAGLPFFPFLSAPPPLHLALSLHLNFPFSLSHLSKFSLSHCFQFSLALPRRLILPLRPLR